MVVLVYVMYFVWSTPLFSDTTPHVASRLFVETDPLLVQAKAANLYSQHRSRSCREKVKRDQRTWAGGNQFEGHPLEGRESSGVCVSFDRTASDAFTPLSTPPPTPINRSSAARTFTAPANIKYGGMRHESEEILMWCGKSLAWASQQQQLQLL